MSALSTILSASSESWKRACREVIVIAIVSLIPLLCRSCYYFFKFKGTKLEISFIESLIRYIVSGELLFFSVANFATILWLCSQDFRSRFDERIYFVLVSVIGLSICTFFIGFNPSLQGIPSDIIRVLSLITFFVSLIGNMVLLVFESYNGVDYTSSAAHEEDDTAKRLANRRGK